MGLTQEIYEGPIRVEQPAHIVHSAPGDAGKMSGDTIAVAYGYIPPDDDIHGWDADIVVHSVAELGPAIQTLQQKIS